jgi:hypothetical protein
MRRSVANRQKRNGGDWPLIVQAIARVGTEPAARFRWLLDFAARDLTDATSLEHARVESYAFLVTGGGAGASRTELDLESLGADPQPSLLGADGQRAVRGLQTRLRHTLRSLQTERRFRGDVKITEAIWTDDGGLCLIAGGNEAHRFDFAVLGLLMELAPRLQTCPAKGCGRLFLKRGRMLYCGSSCSQRTRTARFKQAHPEAVSHNRRARYVRRQQKTLGPKVKVGTVRRKP